MTTLSPDPAAGAEALQADFTHFLWGMLAIFLFAGIGNASTFKQMPMIFERRQAGGVIGWTAAIAAFGPFFFGAILAASEPKFFFALGLVYAVDRRRHHLGALRPPRSTQARLTRRQLKAFTP